MSDNLTDEHHEWVAQTLGVDPRNAAPAAAAPEEKSGGFFSSVAEAAGGLLESAQSAVSSVADTVVEVATQVKDAAVAVENTVETTVAAVGQRVSAKLDDAVQTAKQVGEAVIDKTVSVATTVADAAVSTAKDVGNAVVDTAVSVATTVKDAVVSAGEEVAETVGEVAEAVEKALTPEPPPTIPEARANKELQKLPPEDQKKVQALLDGAKSKSEKQYITKGLAAGHSAAELEGFAAKIAGKDETWLNDNLRLVGDSQGKGIKQQWSYSCGPTTVEAIKGELDPLYAMKIRQDNPDFEGADDADGGKANPKMAQDQKDMLVDGGGVATSRDDPDKLGSGLVFSKLLNKQSGATGLTFETKKIGPDVSLDDALNTLDSGLKSGIPMPITVGDAKSPFAHAALVTAVDPGPPRSFTIHDPYYGKTESFTEDQIKNDQINVGGWKHIGVIFPPSLKD